MELTRTRYSLVVKWGARGIVVSVFFHVEYKFWMARPVYVNIYC